MIEKAEITVSLATPSCSKVIEIVSIQIRKRIDQLRILAERSPALTAARSAARDKKFAVINPTIKIKIPTNTSGRN